MKASGSSAPLLVDHHHHQPKHLQQLYDNYAFDHHSSMHLPQLFSPESAINPAAAVTSFVSPATGISLNTMDFECSQNLLRLTSNGYGGLQVPPERFNGGDWTFLDKLLANSHHHHQHLAQAKCHPSPSSDQVARDHDNVGSTNSTQRLFPFQYLGCDSDILKFSK